MVSPASDYFLVLTVFCIVICYLELAENGEESWLPYGLLGLLSVFAVSVKLSAALIILLALKPAAMLIKEKNGKGIAGFLGMGFLIMLPYFMRNVYISGWLAYPFTAVDMFAVDWKIPKEIADYDAKEIQVWGRGMYDVAEYGKGMSEWFPEWFAAQGKADKLFVLAGLAAVPVSAAALAVAFFRRNRMWQDVLLAAAVVNASFLFWLCSAPLIRYGCVYVWLAAPLTFGGAALWLTEKRERGRMFWRLVYGVVFLAGCYKAVMFGKEVAAGYSAEFFVHQKEYENFEAQSYMIDGVVFYYPEEGDRIGYDAFPASPSKAAIELRGEGLDDGFRYKK